MAPDDLVVETAPAAADVTFLEDRLYEFNVARTGIADGTLLAIFVRDGAGAVTAGLYGWTWGACCEVRYLWVREDLRGRGLGARLLAAAEAEAVRRGCRQIVLDTHGFQAPGFHRKLGYEVFAVLPDYPRGHERLHLCKGLEPATAPGLALPDAC